jgi:hypothetical protein
MESFRLRASDGYTYRLWTCSTCERADKKKWNEQNPAKVAVQKRRHRAKHLERIRAYDRKRDREPIRYGEILENSKAREKTPEGKAYRSELRQRWRREHSEKYLAQTAVGNAVRDGKLKKGPCAACGTTVGRIIGHHHDYSRQLDVTWLCPACHGAEHRVLRWGSQEATRP